MSDTLKKIEEREKRRGSGLLGSMISAEPIAIADPEPIAAAVSVAEPIVKKRGRPAHPERERRQRCSVIVLRSVYEKAQEVAYERRESISRVIEDALVEYIEKKGS